MIDRKIGERYRKAYVSVATQCVFDSVCPECALKLTANFIQADIAISESRLENWGYPRPLPKTVNDINEAILQRKAILKQLAVRDTGKAAEFMREIGTRMRDHLKDPVNQGIGRSFCNLAASLS